MLGGARLAVSREGILKQFGFPTTETVFAGHYEEAEREFLLAGQPREALDMWLYQKNWEAARQLCELHHRSGLHSVIEAQVRASCSAETFSVLDSPLERCALPHLLVIARVLKLNTFQVKSPL